MKLKQIKNWANFEKLEALLFFAQRLDELLFDYTLDTYKAPALNAPSLCSEALNLIADIETETIDSSNLDSVLAELEWSLRNDHVAKKLIGTDLSTFFLGEHAKSQLQKQKTLLELIYKSIAPDLYLLATQEALIAAIEAHEKNSINFLARSWVTTLTNVGVTKSHLFQLVNSFFFGSRSIKELSDVKTFFMESLPFTHEFQVYFAVSKEISKFKDALKGFDIQVIDELPGELKELAAQTKFEIAPDEVIVEVSEAQSFDIHSGRREAEQKLERIRDLILLYSHKRPIVWSGTALVKQCCLDKPVATTTEKSSVQKIADLRPSIAAPRLTYLIENLSLETGGDREKFDRIVDLHGLCAIQEAPETQLINLWICIESLVPSEPSRNKISNIIELVIPILMLIYVRRLIKNLLRDLLEWDKKFVKQIFKKLECNSDEWSAHKVLMLLAPDQEELRIELYKRLDDFPLLRYRIFSMASTFGDPAKLRQLLSEHRKKLEWQIRRIYRTRNLIVHTGRTPSYIPTLIENAHDYLDGMLFEIIEASCSAKRVSTFKQAFELFRIQHIQYEKLLRELDQIDSSNIAKIYYSKQPRKTVDDLFDSHTKLLSQNNRQDQAHPH